MAQQLVCHDDDDLVAHALCDAPARTELHEILQPSKVVGQAVSILTERYQVNDHRGFASLVQALNRADIQSRAVKQELLHENNPHGVDASLSTRVRQKTGDQRMPQDKDSDGAVVLRFTAGAVAATGQKARSSR